MSGSRVEKTMLAVQKESKNYLDAIRGPCVPGPPAAQALTFGAHSHGRGADQNRRHH